LSKTTDVTYDEISLNLQDFDATHGGRQGNKAVCIHWALST